MINLRPESYIGPKPQCAILNIISPLAGRALASSPLYRLEITTCNIDHNCELSFLVFSQANPAPGQCNYVHY